MVRPLLKPARQRLTVLVADRGARTSQTCCGRAGRAVGTSKGCLQCAQSATHPVDLLILRRPPGRTGDVRLFSNVSHTQPHLLSQRKANLHKAMQVVYRGHLGLGGVPWQYATSRTPMLGAVWETTDTLEAGTLKLPPHFFLASLQHLAHQSLLYYFI